MSFRQLMRTVIAAALVLSAATALACTPMGVGRDASADGSVLVTHTCDGWYDNALRIVPGGEHAEGEMVDVYVDLCIANRPYTPLRLAGQIPQVAKTNTYFHIGYPFMNDKQLMIGEHTWTGRDEAMSPDGMLYIANLEVFALQRASTAREAIRVMGELAEKYGYGDGGEGLVIGDTKELWYFEIVGGGLLWSPDSGRPGAHWVAQRIPDDEVFVAANTARIGVVDFEDPETFMFSSDITRLPGEMGWWKEGEPFNFAKIFHPQPANRTFVHNRREWRVMNLFAPSQEFPVINAYNAYPFSVKPDQKIGVRDLMAIYSDHLEGTPYDLTTDPASMPFGDPNRWGLVNSQKPEGKAEFGWERAVAIPRCSYSFVSQSRDWLPDPVGGVLWFGEDAPDTTVYVPIYCGVTEIPKPWTKGGRVEFDHGSAWWAFNAVNNYAQLRWNVMYPEIRAKKASYEDVFFAEQPVLEEIAVRLYDEDPAKAVAYLTERTYSNLEKVENGWWDFLWTLMGRYYDGGVITGEGRMTFPGYPTEYLEQVEFAGTMLRDLENLK
ncbi:MAG TPA: C69 family dipeptidase [Candidatus Limnocylindria bacterium]|nr:C69 family dipeptidase [Candidatus Limnocylindria bacterium]